ncbi:MAG: head maturation protease, ClpP-related [Bacteroidota bacterium]
MKIGIINIFDSISSFGISSKKILSILSEFKEKNITEIEVRINSAGGSLFEGFSIFNQLRDFGNVHTIVDGVAASAASIIALAGSKVSVYKNSYLFIHNPWSLAIGDHNDMESASDDLKKFTQTIIDLYKSKTGLSEDELKDFCNKNTFLNSDECLNYGFADDVIDNYPVKKFVALSSQIVDPDNLDSSMLDESINSIPDHDNSTPPDIDNKLIQLSASLDSLQSAINEFNSFITISDEQKEILSNKILLDKIKNPEPFYFSLSSSFNFSEFLNTKLNEGSFTPAFNKAFSDLIQTLSDIPLFHSSSKSHEDQLVDSLKNLLSSIPDMDLFSTFAKKPELDISSISDNSFENVEIDESQLSLHKKVLALMKSENISYKDAVLKLSSNI